MSTSSESSLLKDIFTSFLGTIIAILIATLFFVFIIRSRLKNSNISKIVSRIIIDIQETIAEHNRHAILVNSST